MTLLCVFKVLLIEYLWNIYKVFMRNDRHGDGMESAYGRLAIGLESAYNRHGELAF